ncbi:MAG TPA: nitroreductase/quinone reductase family protein [Candidatus Dormibacteraeota bacterium]|jgi:deazaflavin-dependent oxidoreductase (nitroreductase family)|nr:nitroreductase/quinone reductase family protein [Candidatus Dormibacteraeota bacterium]
MAIEKTPIGTRGTEMPGGKVLQKMLAPLQKRHIGAYRKTGGTDRMSKMLPFPLILLTTKGAKSGAERIVTLGGFQEGDNSWLIVASKGGSKTHPAWLDNMIAHPDQIWLEVGKRKMKVHAESLRGAEREEAFGRVAAVAPQYGEYPKKTDRVIPVIRLTPVSGS